MEHVWNTWITQQFCGYMWHFLSLVCVLNFFSVLYYEPPCWMPLIVPVSVWQRSQRWCPWAPSSPQRATKVVHEKWLSCETRLIFGVLLPPPPPQKNAPLTSELHPTVCWFLFLFPCWHWSKLGNHNIKNKVLMCCFTYSNKGQLRYVVWWGFDKDNKSSEAYHNPNVTLWDGFLTWLSLAPWQCLLME